MSDYVRMEGRLARDFMDRMQEYRKTTTTRAIQVPYAFEIQQITSGRPSGNVKCPAGTWLALSPNGTLYPIPADQFDRMYEIVE